MITMLSFVRSTPHAHTNYVDGRSTAEQMVLSAISKGFGSLGFSEHGIQSFDPKYSLNERTEPAYIEEIQRLRSKYAAQIRIYLGAERDLYSTADRSQYEYTIGSMHYMPLGEDFVAVDGLPDQIELLIRERYNNDGAKFAQGYFDTLAGYIETYRPDIIGHIDIIRKHNKNERLFDTTDPTYLNAAKQAMERMRATEAILEVNTGAMARGYLNSPYPDLTLLTHWRNLNGRVILSSDCHDATQIDHGYAEAISLIRQAGFSTLWALNPNKGTPFVECSLDTL